MVPYRGRLALRIARVALAFSTLIYYGFTSGWHITWVLAVLAAYAVYSLGAVPEIRFDSPARAAFGLILDAAYFGVLCWAAPGTWLPAASLGYLMASAVILQDLTKTVSVSLAVLVMALVLPPSGTLGILWTTCAVV